MSPVEEKRTWQWFAIGLTALGVVVALVFSAAALLGQRSEANPAVAAVSAPAAASASTPTVVTVAMHDPGCHWFEVNGKFVKARTIKGPVVLANADEATLKVVSASGTKLAPVGQQTALASGSYTINMVGQAPDDNTLKLVVE